MIDRNLRTTLIAVSLFGTFCSPASVAIGLGQQTRPVETADSGLTIEACLAGINAKRSADRQNAKRQLLQFGAEIIAPLEVAIENSESDDQSRLLAVLSELALQDDKELANRALQSLRTIANSGSASTSVLAVEILRRMGSGRHAETIRELAALGAVLETANPSPDAKPEDVSYDVVFNDMWQGSNRDMSRLLWVARPTRVFLIGQQFDDESVAALVHHPWIRALRIKDASITNEAIRLISNMRDLKRLQILYCPIDQDSVPDLEKMNRLELLSLYGTEIDGQTADKIRQNAGYAVDYRQGAYLGIEFDLRQPQLQLTFIDPGSAAREADLRVGDVLIRYEDTKIQVPADFNNTVIQARAGDIIRLSIMRDGIEITKHIRLGKYPDRNP